MEQLYGPSESKTKKMLLVSLFTALMIAGAFIKIPLPLVPITFQAYFSGLAAIVLGPKLGAASQAIYMFLGLAGLPVFSQGGGITYVLKPSFGFIIGFIAGAFVTGTVLKMYRQPKGRHYFIALFAGLAAIYAVGVPYMFLMLKFYLVNPDTQFISLLILNLPYFLKDTALFALTSAAAGSMMPLLKRAGIV